MIGEGCQHEDGSAGRGMERKKEREGGRTVRRIKSSSWPCDGSRPFVRSSGRKNHSMITIIGQTVTPMSCGFLQGVHITIGEPDASVMMMQSREDESARIFKCSMNTWRYRQLPCSHSSSSSRNAAARGGARVREGEEAEDRGMLRTQTCSRRDPGSERHKGVQCHPRPSGGLHRRSRGQTRSMTVECIAPAPSPNEKFRQSSKIATLGKIVQRESGCGGGEVRLT